MKFISSIFCAVCLSFLLNFLVFERAEPSNSHDVALFGKITDKTIPDGEISLAFNFYDKQSKEFIYRAVSKARIEDNTYSTQLRNVSLPRGEEYYLYLTPPEIAAPGVLQDQTPKPIGVVMLQDETPGIQQIGHANISGTLLAGKIGIGKNNPIYPLEIVTSASIALTTSTTDTSGMGLLAKTDGSGGAAIRGHATADSGNTFGVQGFVDSPNGYAGYFLGQGYFSGFLGVGRTSKVTSAEVFGIGSSNASGFAGMYALTGDTGRPFYGYSTAGVVDAYHYYDGADNTWKLYCGGDRITVRKSDGFTNFPSSVKIANLGINADPINPYHLTVDGEAFFSYISPAGIRINSFESSIRQVGSNSASIWTLRGNFDGTNYEGDLRISTYGGVPVAQVYSSQQTGYIYADVKNFREVNPNNPETDIWYACIEGPEAAMYVRGTATLVNGKAEVILPEHFSALASEKEITVMLTPLSEDSLGLAVTNKSTQEFTVKELHKGNGTYDFDWEVKAVRKGYEDYKVVRSWLEHGRGDENSESLWRHRMKRLERLKK
ncbi:MAG TPA: hypothetical protein VNK96_09750 [Fimbriimonadales bacterium]|nr:hypothetical protein [Fimbriimonadales bacterium]